MTTALIPPAPDTPRLVRGLVRGFCAAALMVLVGCSNAPRQGGYTSGSSASGHRESGLASYYGNEFNGRKTASGERFDQAKLTAAHRTLPFGTHVKVTNTQNGKSVVVRVNDRGPFARGRVIDLSSAAFKHIAYLGAGVVPVQIQAID